jgi:ACS family allantoate permease-like MFS transporter
MAITIPAGDLTNFKNVILEGFGLSPEKALLYNAPAGAVMAVANILICYLADRTENRCLWAILSLIGPVICFTLMLTLPQHNVIGQLMAFTFAGTFLASFTLLLSLVASNVAGQTKKTTVNTITSKLPPSSQQLSLLNNL